MAQQLAAVPYQLPYIVPAYFPTTKQHKTYLNDKYYQANEMITHTHPAITKSSHSGIYGSLQCTPGRGTTSRSISLLSYKTRKPPEQGGLEGCLQ